MSLHNAAHMGAVIGSLLAPATLAAPENAPITIALTGNAATDITWSFFKINAMN